MALNDLLGNADERCVNQRDVGGQFETAEKRLPPLRCLLNLFLNECLKSFDKLRVTGQNPDRELIRGQLQEPMACLLCEKVTAEIQIEASRLFPRLYEF